MKSSDTSQQLKPRSRNSGSNVSGNTNARGSLFTLFIIVFVDLLGFGIIIPILPYYAKTFGASGVELGLLMASYSAMQFIFSSLWGSLSDKYGRKPILLMSMVGSALSLTWMGFATTLATLFYARILAGIFGANISTAFAMAADLTSEENRTKGMGIVGAAFGLGFIFGPAIGGALSGISMAAPLFFGAGLIASNFFLAFFILKEPLGSTEDRKLSHSRKLSFDGIRKTLTNAQTLRPIACVFLLTIAIAQMEVTFAYYILEKFGLGARPAGYLLAMMGLIMAGFQGGVTARLAKKYPLTALSTVGFAICAVSLSLFGLADSFVFAVVALAFLGIGHGILQPVLSSWTSLSSDKHSQGATMGVYQSASSLSRIIGPPTAGLLYERVSHPAPYYMGAILLVIALLISLRPASSGQRPAVSS